MIYKLTESNVKDLISWIRGGSVTRALIALEHLTPTVDESDALRARLKEIEGQASIGVIKTDEFGRGDVSLNWYEGRRLPVGTKLYLAAGAKRD